MPPPQASPIPSMGDIKQTESPSGPPPVNHFTVELFQREYKHELRIIDQLVAHMSPLYPVNQEGPPGVSINFTASPDMEKVPQLNDYNLNLVRATAGAWKDWRSEIKKAGIPGWESIKAVAPEPTPASQDSAPAQARGAPFNWGRPSEPQEVKKPAPSKPSSEKVSAISNPSPLPPDPTIQGLSWMNRRNTRATPSDRTSHMQETPTPTISSELKTDDIQAPVTSDPEPASPIPDSTPEIQAAASDSSILTSDPPSRPVESESNAVFQERTVDDQKDLGSQPIAPLEGPQAQATPEESEIAATPSKDDTTMEARPVSAQNDPPAVEAISGSVPEPVNTLENNQQSTQTVGASPELGTDGVNPREPATGISSQTKVDDANTVSQGPALSSGEISEDTGSMKVEINAEGASNPEVDNKPASEAPPAEQTSEAQAESRTAETTPAEAPSKKPWWKIF
ncbi:hypothetical protein Dda_0499 [Drechslerella dactyloides]|uniref:Uncharacterized protein n=1 Tax=Drechslerella dactyloides TaxID=74499 RepID=A0AAD6NMQ1_DREDA|nr:hypothetical protein Dda_0499 [Drechslerella dactyloides]